MAAPQPARSPIPAAPDGLRVRLSLPWTPSAAVELACRPRGITRACASRAAQDRFAASATDVSCASWQNQWVIPWLRPDTPFPPLEAALSEPNGLLAASSDLTPRRLLDAYRRGIFPWYSGDQPVLWWSPDPRMVLFVEEFRVARSLRKRLKQRRLEVRVDTAFRSVIEACANARRRGQDGTWITPAVIDAYVALHEQGNAHSVESWREGRLVGGLYGVAIGRMFFGESMFADEPDASKIALVHLAAMLRERGCPLIDCQQETAHLASFGARPISRREFAHRVAALVHSIQSDSPWATPAGQPPVP